MDALERKMAAHKALVTSCDDLAMTVVSLMGGDAEIEGTDERLEILRWAYSLP
jgi:hypothetical protein